MTRDYYAVLGVATAASSAQIRRAYQRLARQYSPDVNLWQQEVVGVFEEIAEAYRVLGDPMALAFQQAVSGLTADLLADRLSPCAECGASGAAPGSARAACTYCGGLGT